MASLQELEGGTGIYVQFKNGLGNLENRDTVYLEIQGNIPWENTSTECAA